MTSPDPVAAHYGLGGLRARIEAALDDRDDDRPLSEADLSGAAEFHIGGRAATQHLVDRLSLRAGDRVLDLGSGLGGTARFTAATTGAEVVGIDLTPEFVEVASWLSELTGLADCTSFRVGSAVELGPDLVGFDAATLLHVGMNIANKAALARSAAAALSPGGRFAIYDVMAGPNRDSLEFPVPWASESATSHVTPASSYVDALEAAGFVIDDVEDRSEWALAALQQRPGARRSSLNLGLVMGPDTPTKVANMRSNLAAGRIAPTVIVAHRR